MEKELVSILIPVYNRVKIIERTIETAINQTYKNIEVIIIDNCSTDGTWEFLNKYCVIDNRIKLFQNDKNNGPVLNWEKCLNNAKGFYSKFLWSDDLIKETFIEDAISSFDNETAFVLSGIETFNEEGVINKSCFQNRTIYTTNQYLEDFLIYKEIDFPVSPGCALFRTSDLRQSLIINIPNNLNLDFKKFGAGNDLLFFLITAGNYKYIKILPEIQSSFRSHPNSLSESNELGLFYFYSTYFYVINFQMKMYSKFYTAIRLRSLFTKARTYVGLIDKGKFDFHFAYVFLQNKISRKIKSRIMNNTKNHS